jgi:hypothetical protein
MTQQPTLFSQGAPVPPPSPDSDPDQLPGERPTPPTRETPLWMIYLEISVRVVVRLYLGLVLIVLPWTPYWTNNPIFPMAPDLVPVALNGATRGIVSGLGFLNIWIGIMDAVHFRRS